MKRLSREMQNIRQKIMQMLELKIKISEINISLDGINSRLEMAEKIVEFEDKSIEIIPCKEQRKNVFKTRNRHSDLCGIMLGCLTYIYWESYLTRKKMRKNLH